MVISFGNRRLLHTFAYRLTINYYRKMKSKSSSLRKMIVACGVLCALFVAFISIQSAGTLKYIFDGFPLEMADVKWLCITLVAVRYVLAISLVCILMVFLMKIWRGAAAGKLFIRGNQRWLYAMTIIYFFYSLVDGNAGNIVYNGIRQIEIYINEYMLISCFVLIVFAKLYAVAVEVSEEQELTI